MIVRYQNQRGNLLVIAAIALISALLVILFSAALGGYLPLLNQTEKALFFTGSIIFMFGVCAQVIWILRKVRK